MFLEVADSHAPVKRRRVKGAPVNWMNNKINEAMKDRDFHHRRAVKTNSVYRWSNYRRLSDLVNCKIKSAKSKFYCELSKEAKGDSRKTWKVNWLLRVMLNLRGSTHFSVFHCYRNEYLVLLNWYPGPDHVIFCYRVIYLT